MVRDVIAALNEALEYNEPVALETVVEVAGASPAQWASSCWCGPRRLGAAQVAAPWATWARVNWNNGCGKRLWLPYGGTGRPRALSLDGMGWDR